MNKEQFIDLVLQDLRHQSSMAKKPKKTMGGIDLGFGKTSVSQASGDQKSLLLALVRHLGFSNQKKKIKTIQLELQNSSINAKGLSVFPIIAQVWPESDNDVSYTLIVIEFEKTANDLLSLSVFNQNIHLLDALQRVAKDVMESCGMGRTIKKRR